MHLMKRWVTFACPFPEVLMDERGKDLTSEAMAAMVADAGDRGAGGIVFAIGGPFGHGTAVLVDPMKPKLKPPETKLLKLNCDILLSTSAFKSSLRRYTTAPQ
jgi:hypothetical protein